MLRQYINRLVFNLIFQRRFATKQKNSQYLSPSEGGVQIQQGREEEIQKEKR